MNNRLTKEEKLRLLCGKGNWRTEDFDGKLVNVRRTDASMGVRMPMNQNEWQDEAPNVSYPSMQMLANTWDKETARTYAACVADDCLDAGADVLLGPGVNIKRDPLCGRNFEYLSEDPFLAGTLGREYVFGLQGEGAAACVKHFCANNSEINRRQQTSDVDERVLREIYYKPFEMACEAKPLSIMCSYNRINGVRASEYKKGFDVLYNELGFDGIIISDWDAVKDRTASANAGLALEMPFRKENYDGLVEGYKAGKLPDETLDALSDRVLTFVERSKKLQEGKTRKYTKEERIAFTQRAEEESIVLLKNNGVLPLKARSKLSMCGWYARPCGFEWSKNPELVVGGGSGRVIRLTPMFDMKELLEEKFGEIAYEYAFSDTGVVDGFMDQAAAVSNAGESDINLVFAGTGSRVESEGGDRTFMRLSAAQERTILDTAEVNPNTIGVIFAGAPVDMSAWLDKVAAVVWAGFPGERGGEALVNILTGAVCPSGKLSETFPKTYEDTPVYREYRDSQVTRYNEGFDVGYRWYDRHPAGVQFPFGFGLSYTTFAYDGLRLEADGERVKVCYNIKNIGKYDAKEVSEVYVRPISPMVYRPLKELKGFEKTFVKAGSSETVEVVLERSAFAYWSMAKDCWTVDDGVYEIDVGASAQDIRLVGKVKVKNGKLSVLG